MNEWISTAERNTSLNVSPFTAEKFSDILEHKLSDAWVQDNGVERSLGPCNKLHPAARPMNKYI